MARYRAAEVAESKQWLHKLLDEHTGNVLLILRHSAASGASRRITPFMVCGNEDGYTDVRYLGFNIARLMGLTWCADEASVRVNGGGMDMGFHLVSGVSRRLYDDDYRLKHRWL